MTKSKKRTWRAEDSFWGEHTEPVVREEPETNRAYDLEERTARFGEAIIDFARTIPQDSVTSRIISQLVGAATSVGANYVEADDAASKKGISKKHWNLPEGSARDQTFPSDDRSGGSRIKTQSSCALAEARGLHLIFSKIWRSKEKAPASCENPNECAAKPFVIRPSSFVTRHSDHAR